MFLLDTSPKTADFRSMRLSFLVLLLGFIACSNSQNRGKLAIWQSVNWPHFSEATLIDKNGHTSVAQIETTLEFGNRLIRKSVNSDTGFQICETLLTDSDDYLEDTCTSSTGQFKTIHTLDTKGRILKADYIDSNSTVVRKGEYEYPGENEVFRAYNNGALDFTVLGERFGGRTRYTTWINRANEPSIHVREYKESGEGHELFVSSNVRETSRTKVFIRDAKKIALIHEVTQEHPDGMIYGIITDGMPSGFKKTEENFRIAAEDFDFDAAIDFDIAIRIAEKGLKYRSLKHKLST